LPRRRRYDRDRDRGTTARAPVARGAEKINPGRRRRHCDGAGNVLCGGRARNRACPRKPHFNNQIASNRRTGVLAGDAGSSMVRPRAPACAGGPAVPLDRSVACLDKNAGTDVCSADYRSVALPDPAVRSSELAESMQACSISGTIIFLTLAVVIFVKLRSVLGQRYRARAARPMIPIRRAIPCGPTRCAPPPTTMW